MNASIYAAKRRGILSGAALICAAFFAVLGAVPLAAQESKTSQASAGLFTTDVDDFLDVHDWDAVLAEKSLFGFAGYNGAPELGLAAKLGGLYLGIYYNGSLWKDSSTESETVNVNYNSSGFTLTESSRTVTRYLTNPDVTSNNTVNLLLGFAGQGIKLGFTENLTTRPHGWNNTLQNYNNYDSGISMKTTNADGSYESDEYSDFEYANGSLMPSLGWGAKINAGSVVLKPALDVAFAINSNMAKYTRTQKETAGNALTAHTVYESEKDQGYFTVAPTVQFDIDFSDTFGLGFEYTGGFDIYGDNYGTVTKSTDHLDEVTLDGTTTKVTETYTGSTMSSSSHTFTPSFWYEKDIGGLTLGLAGEVGLSLGFDGTASAYKQTTTTSYNAIIAQDSTVTIQTIDGAASPVNTDKTTIQVAPSLAVGVQYKAFNDKLTLNSGIGAQFLGFKTTKTVTAPGTPQKTTTVSKDADGNVISSTTNVSVPPNTSDSTAVSTSWAPFTCTLGAGFTFAFTDTFAVDTQVTTSSFTLNAAQFSLAFIFKK
jgi:hypothetical protein